MRSLLAAALLALAACSDSPTAPHEAARFGGVRVSIGPGVQEFSDPDGFLLTTPRGATSVPAAGDTLLYDSLPAGRTFTATLSGLAPDCWVASATRKVAVLPDTTIDLRFVVNCAKQYGEIRVITRTLGIDAPANGYRYLRNGDESRIGVADTLRLRGMPGSADTLSVLSDVAGCWAEDTLPRIVTYPAYGQAVASTFTNDCGVLLLHVLPPVGSGRFLAANVVSKSLRTLALMHTNAQGFRQSPDGKTIVFMAFNMVTGGNVELYFMTPSATDIRTVMQTRDRENWPSWSVDGTSLFYEDYEHGELRRLDLTTHQVTSLPRVADEETWPIMRPQGDRIAYQAIFGSISEVWTMDSSGGDRQRAFPTGWNLTSPEWSPDGSLLAASGANDPYATRIKIYVGVPGSTPIAVTSPDSGVVDGYPRWSPDGSHLAFIRISADGITRHLMIMRPNGQELDEIPVPYPWNGDYNWLR